MKRGTTHGETTQSMHGFSLVELVAVLAVLALLVSSAIPILSGVFARSSMYNEALALRLFLERAYMFSLSSRQTIAIECSERLLTARHESGEVAATHAIGHGIALDVASIPDKRLLLHPSIAASPATLELRKDSKSCRVIVSLRGRVRITC